MRGVYLQLVKSLNRLPSTDLCFLQPQISTSYLTSESRSFSVVNDSSTSRTEAILVSIPFGMGLYTESSLNSLKVDGFDTSWLILQKWPDNSIKVAQAQFFDTLTANEIKDYTVTAGSANTDSFTRHSWVTELFSSFELGAQVKDTFDVAYSGTVSGTGTILQTTSKSRTYRHRTYHTRSSGGIGRDYLTSNFYVTEFSDVPIILVDWILGNDYLGSDSPGGSTDKNLYPLLGVDVNEAHFLCKGMTTVEPYRASYENVSAMSTIGSYTSFEVMNNTFIGDAQTRRYRFILTMAGAGATGPELTVLNNTLSSMRDYPLYPLASLTNWQTAKAAGLIGGPINGPANASSVYLSEYTSWNNTESNFSSTWTNRGDPKRSTTTGTVRNGPMSRPFAHLLQGQVHKQVQMLEQMAWAQAMRPYHLYSLTVGDEEDICLWEGTPFLVVPGESLGRRDFQTSDPYSAYRTNVIGEPQLPHDWQAYDHEHWTTDLLFDYWTISGDAWAKEELRQLGQSLKGVMRLITFFSSDLMPVRAEGWCMHGFVQAYQATGDTNLKTYAMRRVNEIVEPNRKKLTPGKAFNWQESHPSTGYPNPHEFFMPWQHGSILYGYIAAYLYFEEEILLTICEDIPTTVEYSWLSGVVTQQVGFIEDGLRYYVPATYSGVSVPADYFDDIWIHIGDSPLGGAHTFLIAGLYQLADLTEDEDVRDMALQYGEILRGPLESIDRTDIWNICLPNAD